MSRGDLVITQSGQGGVAAALEAQLEQVKQRALVALAIEANVIMIDAQRRCPVDTSPAGEARRKCTKLPHLRDTAFVKQVEHGRNAGRFRVGFRHPGAKFVNYSRKLKHDNGESHFLTHAIDYARRGMVSRVAAAAKRW